MEIRKLINIITETFDSFEPNVSIETVHKELKREFWYLNYENKNDNVEMWKHKDDPSIGEYLIKKSDNGKVLGIFYRNPNQKLNKTCKTLSNFMFHIKEITEGDIDPEGFEKGVNVIRDIANQLKNKKSIA